MLSSRQKKKSRKIIIIIAIAALVIATGLVLFQTFSYKKPGFVRYPEFGIAIPENYSIHGIDVSKYQSSISWEEVKLMKIKEIQLGFSFMKATEGIGNTDPNFKRNWKKSKDNGIIRGAYHFFIASKDGRMQAATVPQLRREAKVFLDIVENHYGVKPIIYTNVDFYTRNLGNEFDAYPLWVAHYYQPSHPRIKRGWSFWQHSDEGRVNGIDGKVDFNVFGGDSTDFKNLLIN